jgi:hypothetical protein
MPWEVPHGLKGYRDPGEESPAWSSVASSLPPAIPPEANHGGHPINVLYIRMNCCKQQQALPVQAKSWYRSFSKSPRHSASRRHIAVHISVAQEHATPFSADHKGQRQGRSGPASCCPSMPYDGLFLGVGLPSRGYSTLASPPPHPKVLYHDIHRPCHSSLCQVSKTKATLRHAETMSPLCTRQSRMRAKVC